MQESKNHHLADVKLQTPHKWYTTSPHTHTFNLQEKEYAFEIRTSKNKASKAPLIKRRGRPGSTGPTTI